jgi:hypothetical protein
MRFFTCINSEKGTHTIYEIVGGKPVAIKAHPIATETNPKQEKEVKKAK